MVLKIDLHVHTCYSSDGITTPKDVVVYSKRRGLDGVAITDHGTVDGALRLLGRTDLVIIPGIEVTALGGHIIGLNVTNPVTPNLTFSETIRAIRDAGGIAVAAHLGALIEGFRSKMATPDFDAIEVINSTAFPFSLSTYLSKKLAVRLDLPQVAGSDAHYGPEIGLAYTLLDADPEADEIVRSIKKGAGTPFGRPIPWRLRLKRTSLNLKKKYK